MSGIAAFVSLDGAVPPSLLAGHAVETLAWRGDVTKAAAIDERSAVLVHVPSTCAAGHGGQPARGGNARWRVLLDGRLDHREDLQRALACPPGEEGPPSDVELVLRAVETWGEGAVERLEGEFAFLAWNGSERRLLAGRDTFAQRPLFHARRGDLLVVGSDPRLAHGPFGLSAAADEGVLAEHLCGWVTTLEDTLWQGVSRLAPGACLAVVERRVSVHEGWRPDPHGVDMPLCEQDRARALRDLLDDAVRSRLRAPHPVGVHVSGGMDSPSVAATASALLGDDRGAGSGLRGYGLSFPNMACDETSRLEEVLGHVEFPGTVLEHRTEDLDDGVGRLAIHGAPPPNPCHLAWAGLSRRALADGAGAMLDGHGGDEWLGDGVFALSDRIDGLGWFPALRRELSASPGIRKAASRVLRQGLAPRCPTGWLERLDRWRGRSRVPPWLDPGIARRVSLHDRLVDRADPRSMGSHGASARWNNTRAGSWSFTWEDADREDRVTGMPHRRPFLDRRLAEFCLALPSVSPAAGAPPKRLLRTAMAGRLPEHVRTTTSKPAHTPVYAAAIAAAARSGAWDDLALERAGWMNGPMVRRSLTACLDHWGRGGTDRGSHAVALWNVLSLDAWWKHVAEGTSPKPYVPSLPDRRFAMLEAGSTGRWSGATWSGME